MTVKRNRYIGGLSILSFLLFLCAGICFAKDTDYPTKPITCYIPYGAGGTTDLAARALLEAAAKHLGQKFLPVNRAGAAGTLAATTVMKAKPDGYTLGVAPTSAILIAPFSEGAPYKDLSGFTMIMNFANYLMFAGVRDDAPWKTWKDYIAWIKQNPGGAKVGLVGTKTNVSTGIFLLQIEKREKVQFTDVSFKSSQEILTGLLGGHINTYLTSLDASTMQYIESGKIRVLLYFDNLKLPGYENIPAAPELYDFSIPCVVGMFGPRGLPENVLVKLDDAFAKAVKEPEFVQALKKLYTPLVYMNRPQLNAYVDKNFREMSEIYKQLKAEEVKGKK